MKTVKLHPDATIRELLAASADPALARLARIHGEMAVDRRPVPLVDPRDPRPPVVAPGHVGDDG